MKKIDPNYLNLRLSKLMQSPEEKLNKLANLNDLNRNKLLSLQGLYKGKGKRCFIVGSSPSVNDLDLSKLNNEITFTVNRGYKISSMGLAHSTYHIMPDMETLKDEGVRSEIPEDFTTQFLVYAGINFPYLDKTTYFDFNYNPNNLKLELNNCITEPFHSFATVIVYALQIAYFMGFEEVNIIGVDLDFSNIIGHSYKETEGEKKRQSDFSVKQSKFMLDGISHISNQMISRGVKVQNASPVGILNSIPRVDYNNLFKEG